MLSLLLMLFNIRLSVVQLVSEECQETSDADTVGRETEDTYDRGLQETQKILTCKCNCVAYLLYLNESMDMEIYILNHSNNARH